ncbi:MAG: hypothetical protein N2C14_07925, partial [Planctomycetales bacterium]
MASAVTLLVSQDESLAHTVREVVGAMNGLELEIAADVSAGIRGFNREEVALLLIYVSQESEIEEAVGLLKHSGRILSTIVLCDENRTDCQLALLQKGFLSSGGTMVTRPLDLNRLKYLIDQKTLEKRVALRSAPERPKSAATKAFEDEHAYLFDGAHMGEIMDLVHRVAPQDIRI